MNNEDTRYTVKYSAIKPWGESKILLDVVAKLM